MIVIDTNVLVYASATGSPAHARALAALRQIGATDVLAVTRQILREFLSATTRPQPWGGPLTLADATSGTEVLVRELAVLEDGPRVWDELMGFAARFRFAGKQVHDANIVATMLAHGERRLLTFNTADFRRFGDVIEVVTP